MTAPTASTRVDWILFIVLSFLWGSSYLFIKIGVEAEVPPLTLVTLRLILGASLLAAVVAVAREALPRDSRTYGHLVALSVLSVALPFSLIAWAEQRVDSSLAAIVGAAIPLFVVVIAAFVLHDEPIGPKRLAGVVIGFAGVALLVGFDAGRVAASDVAAQLALVGATVSYAAGGVYARRTVYHLRPMIPALFQVAFALVIVAIAAFALERPFSTAVRPEAWLAIAWLGLLGSGVAYLIFFRLLGRWGATRTSTVAYLLPVVGIVLGTAVLGEQIDARLLLGGSLVIVGIAFANTRHSDAGSNYRRRVPEADGALAE
jgi:drug/metabolite transporter (DMT)-like permease